MTPSTDPVALMLTSSTAVTVPVASPNTTTDFARTYALTRPRGDRYDMLRKLDLPVDRTVDVDVLAPARLAFDDDSLPDRDDALRRTSPRGNPSVPRLQIRRRERPQGGRTRPSSDSIRPVVDAQVGALAAAGVVRYAVATRRGGRRGRSSRTPESSCGDVRDGRGADGCAPAIAQRGQVAFGAESRLSRSRHLMPALRPRLAARLVEADPASRRQAGDWDSNPGSRLPRQRCSRIAGFNHPAIPSNTVGFPPPADHAVPNPRSGA